MCISIYQGCETFLIKKSVLKSLLLNNVEKKRNNWTQNIIYIVFSFEIQKKCINNLNCVSANFLFKFSHQSFLIYELLLNILL